MVNYLHSVTIIYRELITLYLILRKSQPGIYENKHEKHLDAFSLYP